MWYSWKMVYGVLVFMTAVIAATSSSPAGWNAQCTNQTKSEGVQKLLLTAAQVIMLQNSEDRLSETAAVSSFLVISITQPNIWRQLLHFHQFLSDANDSFMFVDHVINLARPKDQLLSDTLKLLKIYINQTPTVVISVDDFNILYILIHSMCSSPTFKWTYLLHRAEWIFLYSNLESFATFTENTSFTSICFDFVTFVVSSNSDICVSRRSRGMTSDLKTLRCLNQACSITELKTNFPDLLSHKTNGLEGMHLPAALLFDFGNFAENETDIFVTTYDLFSLDMSNLLARALNFEMSIVTPADENTYGMVLPDGTVTGLTGLVARKEAAFAMGHSLIANRLVAVDYSDTWVTHIPFYLSYSLPASDGQLDTTLINIVQPRFLLTLLGPVIGIAILGGLTHIVTRSCSTKPSAVLLSSSWRRLTTFPDHACFHSNETYSSQTGRILRASWGVFCFVMGAAYSAHLVMGFTVKPTELKLDSFSKLLETPRYRFGAISMNSAFFTYLNSTSDPVQKEIWRKLLEFNKTDPDVLGPNVEKHILKLISGDYAFMEFASIEDFSIYVDADYSNVRSYPLQLFSGFEAAYLIMPKNVFFKDLINAALLSLEETGQIAYLRDKHKLNEASGQGKVKSLPIAKRQSVSFPRILILVYVTMSGLGVALVCLMMECLCYNLKQYLVM